MPKVTAEFTSTTPLLHRGENIIDYLVHKFTYQSKDEWLENLQSGLMTVDGKIVGPDFKLLGADELLFIIKDFDEPDIDTSVESLRSMGDLHIVGKPAGVPIHRTGRILVNTFTNNVKKALKLDAWPLHRLDKETSGLMLFSSSKAFCKKHQSKMDDLLKRKLYLALVHGKFSGIQTIDVAIAQNVGGNLRARMVPTAVDSGGKPSKTVVHKVCTVDDNETSAKTLVLCEIFSGRKHQIRAHLESIGCPIVGDKIYGTDGVDYAEMCETGLPREEVLRRFSYPHQMLHSLCSEIHLAGESFWVQSALLSDAFIHELGLVPNWRDIVEAKLLEIKNIRT